jgi:hypothetical protein
MLNLKNNDAVLPDFADFVDEVEEVCYHGV